MSNSRAEGWYHDPFGVHEARWFSDGTPTALVRDGQSESNDPPPATDYEGPLIPVTEVSARGGDDLLRADQAQQQSIPDMETLNHEEVDAALDTFTTSPAHRDARA